MRHSVAVTLGKGSEANDFERYVSGDFDINGNHPYDIPFLLQDNSHCSVISHQNEINTILEKMQNNEK